MLILNNREDVSAKEICHHIEKQVKIELPEKGFLAGQAVASAYFELTNQNLNPIYNDIDIFHKFPIENFKKQYLKQKYTKKFEYKNNKKIIQEHIFHERQNDGYREQNIRNESIFSIIKSRRLDMFNFISINAHKEKMNIKHLIESFDLNCTKIGIDLETNELYISKDFRDFIEFKKLLLTDFGLPYHNPLRYAKKLFDLEIQSSFDENVLEINNYAISIHRLISEKKDLSFNENMFFSKATPAFGKKYKELYEKHTKLHEYYYMIIDSNYHDSKNQLFKLIPKKQVKILDNKDFYNNISEEMKIYNDNIYKEIRLLKYLLDTLSNNYN